MTKRCDGKQFRTTGRWQAVANTAETRPSSQTPQSHISAPVDKRRLSHGEIGWCANRKCPRFLAVVWRHSIFANAGAVIPPRGSAHHLGQGAESHPLNLMQPNLADKRLSHRILTICKSYKVRLPSPVFARILDNTTKFPGRTKDSVCTRPLAASRARQ